MKAVKNFLMLIFCAVQFASPAFAGRVSITEIALDATTEPPLLTGNSNSFLGEQIDDFFRSIDTANGLTLYQAYQNGLPLVQTAFVVGDTESRSRILKGFADLIRSLPAYDAKRGMSTAYKFEANDTSSAVSDVRIPCIVTVDGIDLTEAQIQSLAGIKLFPTFSPRYDLLPDLFQCRLTIQSGNTQQFAYLLAETVRLASSIKPATSLLPSDAKNLETISSFLVNDILRLYWDILPAWHWARPYADMRERSIARLVETPEMKKRKFFKAFIDYDLFIFAIAADIRSATRKLPVLVSSTQDRELIEDIYDIANRVLDERVETGRNGEQFLFDRGLWSDNPVAEFANCRSRRQPQQPCRWENYVSDISHAQRWPMWLQSFYSASTNDRDRQKHKLWRANLAHQISADVISFDGQGRPLMTNFMDGNDGWYIFPGSENSPPSSMTGWAMRYGAWSLLAHAQPRIGRAQKAFCTVVTSDDQSDIWFRTSYYGHPQSNLAVAAVPLKDDFGIFSDYANNCWLYDMLGFY